MRIPKIKILIAIRVASAELRLRPFWVIVKSPLAKNPSPKSLKSEPVIFFIIAIITYFLLKNLFIFNFFFKLILLF